MKEFHKKNGPFLKSDNSTRKIMRNLLISLLPIIVFSIYKYGIDLYISGKTSLFGIFYPILFIIIPVLENIIIELLYCKLILKEKNIRAHLKNSFCIIPGILLALILPINTPIYIVLLGNLISNIICKLLTKIFKKNVVSCYLLSSFIISIICSLIIGNLDSYGIIYSAIDEGIGTYKTLVEAHGGLINFFLGTVPGAIGTTSVLLCLVAFVYLILTKVIKWKISIVYILTVFVSTLFIGNINGLGIWYPLFNVLSGGVVFAAVFIAPNFYTTPVTPVGQVLYGLFLGILTVIFRYLIPYVDGVLFSILLMSIFVSILDKVGFQSRFNFKKSLIPFFLAWVLILGSGFYIGNKFENVIEVDPNYIVISKKGTADNIVYIVKQKEQLVDIKASISINQGEITEIEILEPNDIIYSKIEENNYIIKLLKKQQNLSELEEIKDNIEISKTLKKIISNTLSDYIKNGGVEYKDDPNFNIISSKISDNKVVYEVTQKGVKDNIKLKIVFRLDVIDSITVLEHNEPDFDILIEQNYIRTLIENQQVLDTISEVSETAKSLKRAVMNTKKDYWRNYEK